MEETEEPDFEGDYKTYDNGYGEYNENVQEDDEINEESEEEEIDEEDDGESGEDSYDDTEASDEQNDEYDNQDQQEAQQERPQAPAFKISSRIISAVEHPFQIMDLDKGLDTFGPTPQFESVLDPGNPQLSVPIYLHPNDSTSRPMMSHYASSHNVLFKITVPKRTGRKRKRGSDEPWHGEVEESTHDGDKSSSAPSLRSRAKLDESKTLRRKLQDNVGQYEAEAVGVIRHTHRFRGMADFSYSMKNHSFMNDFTNKIMSGDVSKFRSLKIRPGTDQSQPADIVAPPLMTQISIPYFYNYSQNPYVRAVDNKDHKDGVEMVNTTAKVKSVGYFIGVADEVPTKPLGRPFMMDPKFDLVVGAMRKCMEERPVWTRRSIINRVAELAYDPDHPDRRLSKDLSPMIVKNAIQFAGYQFKGGPWRDALVRYGYDPRTDPSARQYQCLIFRLHRLDMGQMGEMWHEIRRRELDNTKKNLDEDTRSHMFDGKSYKSDGKVWQVCDITDPLLAKLLRDAPLRPQCELEGSGWYHRGLWAKARAIMKCKMRAIQFGRELTDADFEAALAARDTTPTLESTRSIAIPTPDLKLTDAEWETVRGKRYKNSGRKRPSKALAYNFPTKRVAKTLDKTQGTGEAGPSKAQEANLGEAAAEDDDDVLPTIEDENGQGLRVRFAESDDEDGSEYDEDSGDSDEEDYEQEAPDLGDQLRLAHYNPGAYTDAEQDEDDEDDQGDEEEEEEGEEEESEEDGDDAPPTFRLDTPYASRGSEAP